VLVWHDLLVIVGFLNKEKAVYIYLKFIILSQKCPYFTYNP